jgi:hypothetical protein
MKFREIIIRNKYPIILVGLSVLIRIIVLIFTQPVYTTDTPAYFDVASYIMKWDFTGYDGGRTPGYPLIIFLGQMNGELIVIIQMIMGIFITFLLYKIMLLLSNNYTLSTITGLSYSFYLSLLNREIILATEITTIFYVILSFFILYRILLNIRTGKIKYYQFVLLIVFTSMATLTRPMYIIMNYLFTLFFIIYLVLNKYKFQKILLVVIFMAIPHLLLIEGWIMINKKLTNVAALTTYSGISMTNRVGPFIESAPEEFNDIKYIYIKYREREKQRRGTHECAIWRAYDELLQETGLNKPELCDRITAMCIATIKEEPVKYIKGVMQGWIIFWKPIGLGENANPVIKIFSVVERLIFVLLEVLFFIIPVAFIFIPRIRKAFIFTYEEWAFIIVGYVLILLCSVAQAMVELGMARYSVPTDPVLLLMVIFLVSKLFAKRHILIKRTS